MRLLSKTLERSNVLYTINIFLFPNNDPRNYCCPHNLYTWRQFNYNTIMYIYTHRDVPRVEYDFPYTDRSRGAEKRLTEWLHNI